MRRPRFTQVFFDVDSTLVTIEGIDVLGGDRSEIRAMTADAMEGKISIAEVYGRRLEIIQPSRSSIDELSERYLQAVTPGASELIRDLLAAGSDVHLITAAIEQAVIPLSRHFGLTQRAVHAVRLTFDDDGAYRDFDRRSFLTREKGKEIVIRDLRARSKGNAALIGDGMSDAEARGAVDLFIGFGGVARREPVEALSDVYVTATDLGALRAHLLEASLD